MKYKITMLIMLIVMSWIALGFAVERFVSLVVEDFVTFPNAGVKWGIIIGVSFVVSTLVSILSFFCNKSAKLKIDTDAEFYDNGYSPKYVELLEQQVNMLSGQPSHNNFAPAVVRLANAYLVYDRPDDAFNTINLLRPAELKQKFTSNPIYQRNLMEYYDVQMSVCEAIGNLPRADAVMQDARPFIDYLYKKNTSTDLSIDEMCCNYYCLYGDFQIAQTFADHAGARGGMYKLFENLLNAKIRNGMGNYAEADRYLNAASALAGKKANLRSAVYEYTKSLEKKRCQSQNDLNS